MGAEAKVLYILDESNPNIVCYTCEGHQLEEIDKIIEYRASLSENSITSKFRNIKISGASYDLGKRK